MFTIQASLQKTAETHRDQATKMKHLVASGRRRLYMLWPNISLLLSIEQVIGNCFLIYSSRHCLVCSAHFFPVLCCDGPFWGVQLPSWTPSRKGIFWLTQFQLPVKQDDATICLLHHSRGNHLPGYQWQKASWTYPLL